MKNFYWKKTLWSFGGALFMAVSLFIFIAAGVHYGLTDLLGLTTMAKDALLCCKTVFSWCLVSPAMFKTIFPWVGFGMVITGLTVASIRAGKGLFISRRFLRSLTPALKDRLPLPGYLAEAVKTEIIPFQDTVLKSAFTIGLLSPRVYVSEGLIRELTREELNAVIVHEIHHAVNKDPLRLFIMCFIKDVFFFIPLGRYFVDSFYVHKELAADERVVSVTGEPFALAQALLKMVRMDRGGLPAGVPVLDKDGLVEKRVKELLEPDPGRDKLPRGAVVFTTVGIASLLVALVLPIYADTNEMEKCNQDYCLSDESECPSDMEDCEKSCDEMERK